MTSFVTHNQQRLLNLKMGDRVRLDNLGGNVEGIVQGVDFQSGRCMVSVERDKYVANYHAAISDVVVLDEGERSE